MTPVEFHRSREPKLLRTISMRSVFMTSMACPIVALILSFILGAALHPSQLFSYRWTCGTVYMPSISRVMNMPLERTIFQTLILSSVPLRLLVLLKQWLEYSTEDASRGFVVARTLMKICGAADVLLLSLLSVIGERENGDIHVILFGGFAAASYVYFICVCLLTRWTFTGSQSDVWRSKLQRTFLACVTFTIPVIIVLFILYNGFCVPFTYELFTVFEYVTVLAMYAFHLSSLPKMNGRLYVFHSSIKSRTQRV